MAVSEEKPGWLAWVAGALAAPAFIVPIVLAVIAVVHYYQGAGWRILMSDVTLGAAYAATTALARKQRGSWIWWGVCLGASAASAWVLWLRVDSDLTAWLLFYLLVDLILNSPAANRWRRAGRHGASLNA